MSTEVLITTVNNSGIERLLEQMNIQTNACVGNQCNTNSVEKIIWKNKEIKIYSFKEKGVGLNRNNILMRSDADICILGDDDMEFVDGYELIVENAFKNNPEADVIIFNLEEEIVRRYVIRNKFSVNYLNFSRFGAARIAFRRKPIFFNGIFFNQCFGGGCQYSHGEDTLFLLACLKARLNIVALPLTIAKLKESESTWFSGYHEKYFFDQGILFYAISKKYYRLLCLQDIIRHKKEYGIRKSEILKYYNIMIEGVRGCKSYQ